MYADSSPVNPIASALDWLEGTLLGTIATAVAILAIASVGLLMLTGRIDFRRSVQVILGCFILFGASTIAAGIQSAIGGTGSSDVRTEVNLPQSFYSPAPLPDYPQGKPPSSDPYAGAAVPTRD